jgi:WD40 repeat protein
MGRRNWAIVGLAALLAIAAVVRFAVRLSQPPVAVAKQIATVSVAAPRGGALRRPFYAPAIDLSADGRVVVAAAQDGAACLWRIGADNRLEQTAEIGPLEIKTDVPSLTCLRMTPDARLVVCAFAVESSEKTNAPKPGLWPTETGLVRIWNLEKRESRTLATLPGPPEFVAISPRGETIAVSQSHGGALRVLDGESGKILWSDSKANFGFEIAFSPEGKLLAACAGRSVRVYEARTGRIIRTCVTAGGMGAVCFSADGSRIAAGGADPHVYVWKVSQPTEDVVLPLAPMPSGDEPVDTVEAIAFDAKSDSVVAYLPRQERPDFWENLQNPPTPGITQTHVTGSLIVRREVSRHGAKTALLATDSLFARARFAQNASRFVESQLENRSVGVWQY